MIRLDLGPQRYIVADGLHGVGRFAANLRSSPNCHFSAHRVIKCLRGAGSRQAPRNLRIAFHAASGNSNRGGQAGHAQLPRWRLRLCWLRNAGSGDPRPPSPATPQPPQLAPGLPATCGRAGWRHSWPHYGAIGMRPCSVPGPPLSGPPAFWLLRLPLPRAPVPG